MRENCNTVLTTRRVRLVPYMPAHVDTYHGWMQDEEILRLTGSEPLTLEEERRNQQSWKEDPNKVTFIVCAAASSVDGASSTDDVTAGMCGDVNAFLWEEDVSDDGKTTDAADGGEPSGERLARLCAELEVMIADARWRRQGLARESLLLLIHWLLEHAPRAIAVLVVKIGEDNEPSRRLFESLGFAVHKHLTVFAEVELRMDVDVARVAAARHWEEAGARELRIEGPQGPVAAAPAES